MATRIEHHPASETHSSGVPRSWIWAAVVAAALVALLAALRFEGGDLLRERVESTLNRNLKGYTVHLPDLELDLLGFGLRLIDIAVVQNAHPKPPVARIADMALTVDWRALLSARLVADMTLQNPQLHVDRRQLVTEAKDGTNLGDRGWQAAVEAIYPLNINRFEVSGGSLTYIDTDPKKPLLLSDVTIVAENIRNVRSEAGSYPSPLEIDAALFKSGRVRLDGNADFLAEPHAAVDADIELKKVPLDPLDPVADEVNIRIRGGTLGAGGHVEYGPRTKNVRLERLRIDGVDVDYLQSEGTPIQEERRGKIAEETAEELSKQAQTHIVVDRVELRGSQLSYTSQPQGYRLFLADTDVTVRNVDNREQAEPAQFEANARFMGQGNASLRGRYQPGAQTPDFNVALQIDATPLPLLNDLFQAYGNFDVVSGTFTFYSEIAVRNRRIDGYVKPLFTDIDVYDRRQDSDKSIFKQAYEGIVGGASKLLENPREDIAAKVDLSGALDDPNVSTLQTVLSLVQNAFFRAILPGFERETKKD